MIDHLQKILVTAEQIQERVAALGREITDTYKGEEILIVAVINGAVMFTGDLMREIPSIVRLDCIRASTYKNDTYPQADPEILSTVKVNLEGRHVLLVDDILDTGRTIVCVTELLQKLKPATLRTCVLLQKRGRLELDFEADFVGFQIPDEFVVGYGLDFAECYRNLPCIGVLKPELQNPPETP